MFGVPPNTLLLVIYIGIFCYWVLWHYNMSFKTIAGGFNGAFWWYGPLSEDQELFLQIYQNYLVALSSTLLWQHCYVVTQLRARRVLLLLTMFRENQKGTITALVQGDSAPLVLNGTSLHCLSALLVLNWLDVLVRWCKADISSAVVEDRTLCRHVGTYFIPTAIFVDKTMGIMTFITVVMFQPKIQTSNSAMGLIGDFLMVNSPLSEASRIFLTNLPKLCCGFSQAV